MTYPQILDRATGILGGLQERGLQPGSSTILQVPTLDGYLVALWVCLLGGIRPVALTCASRFDGSDPAIEKLGRAWRLLGRPAVLAVGDPVVGLREVFGDRLRVIDLAACEGTAAIRPSGQAGADDVVLYMLSSGSTGRAKVIPLTNRGLIEFAIGIRDMLEVRRGDVSFNWLPLDHSGALLLHHLLQVFVGATNLHAEPDVVLADPLRWLTIVDRHRVTQTWAPTFGYKLLVEALRTRPPSRFDLSSVRAWISGGEQITVPVVTDFLAATSGFGVEPAQFVAGWGMTETCTGIAFKRFGRPGSVRRLRKTGPHGTAVLADDSVPDSRCTAVVGVGPPAPGAEFRIVDADDRLVPEGVAGRLQVRSARITPGYAADPAANREAFRDGGWFDTGDLGVLVGGELAVTGRRKDVIIVNGINYLSHEIEEIAGAVPGVHPGCVAAFGLPSAQRGSEDLAVVFVPADAGVAGTVGPAITEALRTRLGLIPACVEPMPESDFPRTAGGKIRRSALRERMLRGEPPAASTAHRLQPAVSGSSHGLHVPVLRVFREVLGTDVDPLRPLFEQGVTSISLPALAARLGAALGREVTPDMIVAYGTVDALARSLTETSAARSEPRAPVAGTPRTTGRVAIIGMALRFPGARTAEEFWANLRAGVESIRRFTPDELAAAGTPASWSEQPDFVAAAGVLDDVAAFDAELFGMSGREAELTDPQHRLLLECAYEALELAGYGNPDSSASVAVFAGCGMNLFTHHSYLLRNLARLIGPGADPVTAMQVAVGNQPDFLATRIAYRLGLSGPAVTVQTACSTGLVAVHLAAQALLAGEADLALAGAAAIHVPQVTGYRHGEGMVLSPTGRCRPFDAAADGTVGGSGVAVVVLKGLERALDDGDTVHAIIEGSAINNDGAGKVGFTAPSVAGQAAALRAAWRAAGVRADEIGYIETHGTGTRLGDPLEFQALVEAFGPRTGQAGACALGSVKANTGHLDSCAGLAGLIKTALVVRHGQMPPQINFSVPNPAMPLDGGPFVVPTWLTVWPDDGGPRRAGVTALGVGGTNAHVVVAQPPRQPARAARAVPAPGLLPLSAQREGSLRELARRFRDRLRSGEVPDLADLTVTMGGRRHLRHRVVALGDSTAAIADALDAFLRGDVTSALVHGETTHDGPGPVVFAFTGQGSQYHGMARALYQRFPAFSEVLDRCVARFAATSNRDLRGPLLEAEGPPWTTDLVQPALYAFGVALARLWRSIGVEPDYVVGHSVGEYAAWCVAGGIGLEDGLDMVAIRGALMEQSCPPGRMVAVRASRRTVDAVRMVVPELDLAVVNGERDVVLAGRPRMIEEAVLLLQRRGAAVRRLAATRGFHSALLDPMLPDLRRQFAAVPFHPLRTPLVSGIDGAFLPAGTCAGADYFVRQTRARARYDLALARLVEAGCGLFVEVGPDAVLTRVGRRNHPATQWFPSQHQGAGDISLLRAAAALHVRGVVLDWAALAGGSGGRRVPLPTYPFQRTRHWIDGS